MKTDTIETDEKAIMVKKVSNKKAYLTKLLKSAGKYSPEMAPQVAVVAQLIVKTEELGNSILSGEYDSIIVETSREGAPREKASAAEMLYLNYVDRVQRGLKSLGMNNDSRERKGNTDELNDFLKNFQND